MHAYDASTIFFIWTFPFKKKSFLEHSFGFDLQEETDVQGFSDQSDVTQTLAQVGRRQYLCESVGLLEAGPAKTFES
jgi:hypothetical protein